MINQNSNPIFKGTMHTTEPCAPLQFLLSPKFLSSDRARITPYVIIKCVPFMKASQMTDTLELVLSGKRRESLKVTAYKEVIRLLASIPSEKHIKMIAKEWSRPNLHRDVKIAIVQQVIHVILRSTIVNLINHPLFIQHRPLTS